MSDHESKRDNERICCIVNLSNRINHNGPLGVVAKPIHFLISI